MIDKASPSRRRPRLSLLSLLLLMTSVALGLGLWWTYQLAERFQSAMSTALSENYRLKGELGEFNVIDPSRIYADRVRRDLTEKLGHRYWCWRVWIPDKPAYRLNFTDGSIPARENSLQKPTFSEPIDPGDHRVEVLYKQNLEQQDLDPWRLTVQVASWGADSKGTFTNSSRVPETSWLRLDNDRSKAWLLHQPDEGVDWGRVTVDDDKSVQAGKRVVLQRWRVQTVPPNPTGKPYNGYQNIPNFDPEADAPGFIIWLEPVP